MKIELYLRLNCQIKMKARDFVKKKYFNKYDDVIVEICAIVDLRDKEA